MGKALLIGTLVVALGGQASAQCCGDCGNDGAVTINDLIVAVNNALNGCASPTPTSGASPTRTTRPTVTPTTAPRCPFALNQNSGSNVCQFHGPFNRGCGNELDSRLATSGTSAIVAIATQLANPAVVYFSAHVNSATSASLTAWTTDPNFQDVHPVAGTLDLTDNRSQLVIFPNDPPFMILSCNFVQYSGAFVGSFGASAATSEADGDLERALAGLASWRAPIPELSQP